MALSVLSGCAANKLTSPLLTEISNAENRIDLRNISLLTEPPQDTRFEKMIDKLQAAKIFKEVDYANQIKNKPDLILTLIDKKETPDFFHACSMGFEGGIVTVATLGLIPQICHQQQTYYFKISSPGNNKSIEMNIPIERKSIFGWLGLLYNISPHWTWRYPEDKEQNLLITVIEQKPNEIANLLQ
jgi:hypothetical protein